MDKFWEWFEKERTSFPLSKEEIVDLRSRGALEILVGPMIAYLFSKEGFKFTINNRDIFSFEQFYIWVNTGVDWI